MRRMLFLLLAGSSLLLAGGLFVAVAGAGGGCQGAGAFPTEAGSTVVKIDGCTYAPTINRVPVGAEVTFLNTGTGPHDVTGRPGTWSSRLLEPGDSWSTRFSAPGIYAYSCSLHPGMAGVVVAAAQGGAPQPPSLAAQPSQPPIEADDGAPVAAIAFGGIGLVLGALGSAFVSRRRDTAA